MLYILETLDTIVDTLTPGSELDRIIQDEHRHINASCTIVSDAFIVADARAYMSNRNKLFCAKIAEALGVGANIVLIAPKASYIDKRLRNKAKVITLEPTKIEETKDGL